MKKLIITVLASAGLALGAFAQGTIILDNSNASYGVAGGIPGKYYSGTYGLELWVANLAAVPSGINGPGTDSSAPYAALSADGYKLEATFAHQTMSASNPGVFQLGVVAMPDVTPHASSAVIGLVAWNNSATSASSAFASGAIVGVVSFLDSNIADPSPISGPPGVPVDLSAAWTTGDLVLAVPEPSTFALAGLGAAAFSFFRRRRC
jgi:hypothetical protein